MKFILKTTLMLLVLAVSGFAFFLGMGYFSWKETRKAMQDPHYSVKVIAEALEKNDAKIARHIFTGEDFFKRKEFSGNLTSIRGLGHTHYKLTFLPEIHNLKEDEIALTGSLRSKYYGNNSHSPITLFFVKSKVDGAYNFAKLCLKTLPRCDNQSL